MLNPIVSAVVYFFEMLIAYIFFSKVAEHRKSPFHSWLIGIVCFECAAVANLLFSNTIWVNLISFCIANLVFSLLCFHLKPGIAIFYTCILTALMSALEITSIFVISALFGSRITSYNSNDLLLMLDISISKTLYFLTCLILTNFIVSSKGHRKFPVGLYAYPTGVFVCLTLFWYICAQQPLSYKNQYLLSVVSIILFGSTVILFITYQHSLERENEYMLVESEFKRLQTEKSYYDILEHQNRQLMVYAHDAKNHLNCIQNLNTDERVNSYIEKLTDQLNHYTDYCHSGNKILDVIISKYATICELRGICFEYDVQLCNLNQIDDFDLVAILGNLLDNALTAAESSMAKKLSIATAIRNSFYVIVLENSCDIPPILNEGRLISTKTDGMPHGFGLKSVSKTLKKYHGDFDWEYDEINNIFSVTVMLENCT